jgi:hypothetical protein
MVMEVEEVGEVEEVEVLILPVVLMMVVKRVLVLYSFF